MMFRKYKVILVSFIVTALILGTAGVGAALADEPNGNSDGIIRAAYQKVNGMLRILGDDGEPRPSEEYLEWNVMGPAGPEGPMGPMGPAGPEGPMGPAVEQHIGTKIAPGLYEVHTRVLWDLGWLDENNKDGGGFFNYYKDPKALVYATNRLTFLSPLKGYGIPDVQPGATRKVRLYVNYGHQLDSEGTPTIQIGDVEFYLPQIGGFYGDMAAGWSNYRTFAEYGHLGHAGIQLYNKDTIWWWDPAKPTGTMYRIEAHFYDEFPE